MKYFTRVVIFTGASLVVGCATQAPATSPGASGGTTAATSSTAPQIAAAVAQSPNPQAQAASLNSQSGSVPQKDDSTTSGYDRVIVHGQELFCRREATPGTRVTSKVCRTKAELEAAQEAAKQYMDAAQRSSGAMGNGQPANMPAGPY